MKTQSTFVIMASVLLSQVTFAQTTNLVVNGSFEDNAYEPVGEFKVLSAGDSGITGWTVKSVGIDYIGYHWVHSDGSRSIDLNAYKAGGIMQDITTTPGSTYLVEFDLAGNPSGKTAPYYSPSIKTLNVSAADESQAFSFDVTNTSRSTMGWTGQSWSFTAITTTTTLSFDSTCFGPDWEGYAGWFGPAIDNVRVFEVAITNQPPVALADEALMGFAGELLALDASASYDPEGEPLIYKWSFGDNTTAETINPIVEHIYTTEGVYSVTLVVNDGTHDSEPFTTNATIVTTFTGGGQRSDVDAFLVYWSPSERSTNLPIGTTDFEVNLIYGETILEGTFEATLNGSPIFGFNPVADTWDTVTIPLSPGRNKLLLKVNGIRTDGHTATDRDQLIFVVK